MHPLSLFHSRSQAISLTVCLVHLAKCEALVDLNHCHGVQVPESLVKRSSDSVYLKMCVAPLDLSGFLQWKTVGYSNFYSYFSNKSGLAWWDRIQILASFHFHWHLSAYYKDFLQTQCVQVVNIFNIGSLLLNEIINNISWKPWFMYQKYSTFFIKYKGFILVIEHVWHAESPSFNTQHRQLKVFRCKLVQTATGWGSGEPLPVTVLELTNGVI